ncbi:hypothetical protein ACWCXB_30050 [Streptomyces sp. NPDC001514]
MEQAPLVHTRTNDGADEATVAVGHDRPAPTASPALPWPPRTQGVRRHGTLIRLSGPFTDEDLTAVRASLPARQATRDGDTITIWPTGAHEVITHHNGLLILRGAFDIWSVTAVRAAHPNQFVSLDGDVITIWPATVDPTQLQP